MGLNGGGGGTEFIFSFVTGIDDLATPAVNLFAHLGFVVVPGFVGSIDLGVDFALSRANYPYAKLRVGFGGTFGVGLELKFGF